MGSLDKLTDGLTYRDLAGRRRLRRYTLASIAIFSLICGITFWGWWQRGQLVLLGVSTPTATLNGAYRAEASPATTAALAETQLPSSSVLDTEFPSKAVPFAPLATPDACPQDPQAWEFLEIAQGDHFKRITPNCVYDGLARTVAWDLLRAMGYSAAEAADELGFASFPWRPVAEITGMTDTWGPMNIELEYSGDAVKSQVRQPDFRTWIVDRQGDPGMVFALRGCYRTETVIDGQVQSWGAAYPVECVVSVDQMDWALLELGAYRYAFNLSAIRQFAIYGYAGDGLWVDIGYQKEPIIEVRLPGSSDSGVLPLTMELGQIVQDRNFIAGLHGLVPWDGAWLEEAYGLAMHPLPESWQSLNDQADFQAIQEGANSMFERREVP
jgi:hypothetical protein